MGGHHAGRIEQPSGVIGREFGAPYVLTDLRHAAFIQQAAKDTGMLEVYRDGEAVIYEVRGG